MWVTAWTFLKDIYRYNQIPTQHWHLYIHLHVCICYNVLTEKYTWKQNSWNNIHLHYLIIFQIANDAWFIERMFVIFNFLYRPLNNGRNGQTNNHLLKKTANKTPTLFDKGFYKAELICLKRFVCYIKDYNYVLSRAYIVEVRILITIFSMMKHENMFVRHHFSLRSINQWKHLEQTRDDAFVLI